MPALPSVNFVHRRGKCATPTGQTVAELMIGMYLVSVAVAMMRGSSSVRARVQRYRFSILGRGRATRFERQFCDAGFVEFAETGRDHLIVLRFSSGGQGQLETGAAPEPECDAGILGRMRGGEITRVVVVLHVLAVGLQDARIGAGLREDFAQHRQIQSERFAEAETFG